MEKRSLGRPPWKEHCPSGVDGHHSHVPTRTILRYPAYRGPGAQDRGAKGLYGSLKIQSIVLCKLHNGFEQQPSTILIQVSSQTRQIRKSITSSRLAALQSISSPLHHTTAESRRDTHQAFCSGLRPNHRLCRS